MNDMRYYILTYGCQMNKADSERLAQKLEKRGYRPALKMNEADLIVVNMCSVRQQAVDRIFGINMKFTGIIKNNAKKVLTGCILRKDREKFAKVFDEIWDNKNYFNISPKCPKNKVVTAYVPISNGCNNLCTYCVVPKTRGKLRCRPAATILKEARNFAKAGAKEIWLLGQNVNDYHSGKTNFAKLIATIDRMPGNFKFFFTSPHPKNFSDELIETLGRCQKYGRYLNLPIQSGDDAILRAMNRNYRVQQYEELVRKIREKMPDINLSTDIIVGFPGETERQFQNTAKLFKRIKFDIAYVAKYSPRPSTAALQLKDGVSREEKKRREKFLKKLTKHG
jgi:tRNA-2-methylthio-N6-dimethylallyladenosine synthase